MLPMVRSATGEAPGAATAHSALAGIASLVGPGNAGGASALRFLPDTLTVRRGDLVVWTMPDPMEIHTVTFTSGEAPPEFIEPRFGPGGPASGPPTLVINANVAGAAGGPGYTGQGYLNSGILGSGQSFVLNIDAPAGAYDYICLVHGPSMKGTIVVTE